LGQHIVIWISRPGLAGRLVELARLLGVSYSIPRTLAECRDSLVITDTYMAESIGSSCGRIVVVDEEGTGVLTAILDFVKAVRGRLYEAILGIDVGSSRLAYVLLSAGVILYSGFAPLDSHELLHSICMAAQRHGELAVAIGYSPAVSPYASMIAERLENCGVRVYIVDEYRSNKAPLLGIRGIEKLSSDDLRAAVVIALRAYMNGHKPKVNE